MKKLLISFLTGMIALSSCTNNKKENVITLNIDGYSDSTQFYLSIPEKGEKIDSAYLVNNKLEFTTKVTEPTFLSLDAKFENPESHEFVFFWFDNNSIVINAKKGELKFAEITGTKLQEEASLLEKNKKDIYLKIDSLYNMSHSSENSTAIRELQNDLFDKLLIEDTIFIRNHPNSIHSTFLLGFLTERIPKENIISLHDNLSDSIKKTKYAKKVSKSLELGKDFKIGDLAENFELPNLNSEMISLNAYREKFVLLEFWASGCGPCRQENPNLLKNYKKYKNKGFEIFSITVDRNKENWRNAVKKDSMIWTTVGDLKGMDGDVILTYKLKFIPKNYLINPDGIIIAENLRGDQLGDKLEEIFN